MRLTLVCSIVLCGVLAGCGAKEAPPGPDDVSPEVVRQRAALAEPLIEAIRKNVDPAKIPPVTNDTPLPAGFPFTEDKIYDPEEKDQVLVLYPEDLQAPSGYKEVPYSVPHGRFSSCLKGVAESKDPAKTRFYKTTLLGCTNLKYVLLVRPTKVVDAKTSTTRNAREEKTLFTKGRVEGDVVAVEIATGKVVGGSRFAAETSSDPGDIYSGSPEDVLKKDLEKRVREAIKRLK